MVKFAKNGSDATTAALKLARAATGRDTVAVADQPFFSTDDWFIGNTPMNAGIPDAVRAGTVGFTYNDLGSLRALFDAHPGRIAAVFMEAATALHDPAPGFLEGVREMCTAEGTVLVFDEMITGFRWSASGAQAVYGVTPDLSTWGKAMGNGFPVSALAGRRELMELGGLRTDADRVFLLSTTHGPETAGLTAFRAVVEAYRREDPVATMRRQGTTLAEACNEVVAAAGLGEFVDVVGHPACLVFRTRDASGRPSQEMRTVFLAELLRRGVLGQSFVISAAHTDADVEQTVNAVAGALPAYERALELGADAVLDGRPVAPALRSTAAPRRASEPPRHRPASGGPGRGPRRDGHAVVGAGELLGHRREVRGADEVPQRRARALGVDVDRPPPGGDVVDVDDPEVDGEPGAPGGVRHRRVQLGCPRRPSSRPRRANEPRTCGSSSIGSSGRVGLVTGVLADVLGGVLAAAPGSTRPVVAGRSRSRSPASCTSGGRP